VRVNYSGGWEDGPFTGATINLATGVVANDGHGGTDIIKILGGNGRFELQGSNNADNITGSNRNETFILRGGFDTLRYDRDGYGGVNVDLSQGAVLGDWRGESFVHTISGIEEVRGSRGGNDTMTGDAGDNRLRAYDGDDFFQGFGGTDRLYGGNGNDTLEPGDNDNFDYVDPGAGDDEVLASTVFNGFLEIGHYDLRNSTGVTATFEMDGDFNSLDNASVSKGSFGTTTVLGASTAFLTEGIFFIGGNLDDTFTTTLTEDGWISFKGGRGNDTYVINTSEAGEDATVRLNFDRGIDNSERPDQGINADLETGIISNDGFGGRDVITESYTATVEIRGTDNTDIIMGSDRDERFIGRGGKGGFDAVRFDRDDVDGGVRVDLGAGTATSSFSGIAFNYALTNIEGVAGSYDADWRHWQ
jgi:hypothetical protein